MSVRESYSRALEQGTLTRPTSTELSAFIILRHLHYYLSTRYGTCSEVDSIMGGVSEHVSEDLFVITNKNGLSIKCGPQKRWYSFVLLWCIQFHTQGWRMRTTCPDFSVVYFSVWSKSICESAVQLLSTMEKSACLSYPGSPGHAVEMTWDAPKMNKRICSFLCGTLLMANHWQKSQFSDCCSADFCSRLPACKSAVQQSKYRWIWDFCQWLLMTDNRWEIGHKKIALLELWADHERVDECLRRRGKHIWSCFRKKG